MKRALLAAAAVLALALAGQAQAVTLVNPDGTPSAYQRWANRLPVPTVKARLTVTGDQSVCPNVIACTLTVADLTCDDTIWLHPRGGSGDRYALAHELGHQFGCRVLTDADRMALTPLLGAPPGTPWNSCDWSPVSGCVEYEQSPDEGFAFAYANCTPVGQGGEVYSGVDGGAAMQANEKRLCKRIRVIARSRSGAVDWRKPTLHPARRRPTFAHE